MRTPPPVSPDPAMNPATFSRLRSLLRFGSASLIVAAIVAAAPLRAQTGAIEGRVLNVATGDYLNNVRVTVDGTSLEGQTDATGSYRIGSVPSGKVALHVTYTGLDGQQAVLDVAPGATVRHNFELTSKARYGAELETVKMDQFTVAVTREMEAGAIAINEQRYAPNIKTVVAADAFGDLTEGNVGEFLKFLPGVMTNMNSVGDANNISLRGFPGAATPVTVDGNRMASAASSGSSRIFELEQVSMSNVARIEVVKSPIPSMSADSLGGTVNLISKSAFERSRPQLMLRGFLAFTGEERSLSKTPGPGARMTPKVRPGFELSYVKPVNETFGFVVNAMSSNQVSRERRSANTWEYAAANGGTEVAPYLRGYLLRDDPRETLRQSFGTNVDWRPVQPLTLSFGYQWNLYDLLTSTNTLTTNTGATPVSYGHDFTQGRTNAGSITHGGTLISKYGQTNHRTFNARYRRGDWKVDFSSAYSKATNRYRDTSEGFFQTLTDRIVTPTVRYEQNQPWRPGAIVAQTSTGSAIDWTKLSSYQLLTAQSTPRNSYDEITTGRLDARRELMLAARPAALQVGGTVRRQVRDRQNDTLSYSFVGADGRAQTADDNAGVIVSDVYSGQNPYWGWPHTIQWPSLEKYYQLYQAHPEYFVLNTTSAWINHATNSERIQETISAAYVQGEIKLFNSRLALVGGVRMERTEDSGLGLKRDRDAIYQRDASGKITRGANNLPVLITTDLTAQAKLSYIERGTKASISYQDYYPSLNAVFNVRENLLLRAGYAKTVGRPDFGNIIPNIDIDENEAATAGQPGGAIVMRNPALKPWSADNFDFTLEYYFQQTGVASVSVFHKRITNPFLSKIYTLDSRLLAEFGLDAVYDGWQLTTTTNSGSGTVSGIELNYQQQLRMLPNWARGISVFANGTFLDPDGESESSFENPVRKMGNWGVSYSRGRIGLQLKWNYVGWRFVSNPTFAPDAVRYVSHRITFDTNVEFRIDRRLNLFFNARNLTHQPTDTRNWSSRSPSYSHPSQRALVTTRCSVGIKGTF